MWHFDCYNYSSLRRSLQACFLTPRKLIKILYEFNSQAIHRVALVIRYEGQALQGMITQFDHYLPIDDIHNLVLLLLLIFDKLNSLITDLEEARHESEYDIIKFYFLSLLAKLERSIPVCLKIFLVQVLEAWVNSVVQVRHQCNFHLTFECLPLRVFQCL